MDHSGVFAYREIIASGAEQRNKITRVFEAGLDDPLYIFDQTEHSYHWSRQDAAAFRLVVKRDVARHDRCIESPASFSNAVDDFRERPHHFRSFGRSKVQ